MTVSRSETRTESETRFWSQVQTKFRFEQVAQVRSRLRLSQVVSQLVRASGPRYQPVCVRFLYTWKSRRLDLLTAQTSRNGRQPSDSCSIVNRLAGSMEFRCVWRQSISLVFTMQKQSSTYRRKHTGPGEKVSRAFLSIASIARFGTVTEIAAPIAIPLVFL